MTSERERSDHLKRLPMWRLELHETLTRAELEEQRARRKEEYSRLEEWWKDDRAWLVDQHAWLEEQDARVKRERLEYVRSARFLLAIAVWLLPPSERDRYLEEFRAELLDVPRDAQLSHAVSLLWGAFVLRLRRGLKKPTDVAVRRANDVPSTSST
jgi:hypothetical protein